MFTKSEEIKGADPFSGMLAADEPVPREKRGDMLAN
jgi:hypothetical protein